MGDVKNGKISGNPKLDPHESEEQSTLFEWAGYMSATGKYPELKWLFHVPNGGKRDKVTAAKSKFSEAEFMAAGVKPGAPDIFLDCPRGAYHGLRIELKIKGGRLSENQAEWIRYYQEQCYAAVVCYGADEAIAVIEKYLRGTNWDLFQKDLNIISQSEIYSSRRSIVKNQKNSRDK